jgi:hypothetical protein
MEHVDLIPKSKRRYTPDTVQDSLMEEPEEEEKDEHVSILEQDLTVEVSLSLKPAWPCPAAVSLLELPHSMSCTMIYLAGDMLLLDDMYSVLVYDVVSK